MFATAMFNDVNLENTMRNLFYRKVQIEDSFLGEPQPDQSLVKEARMIQGVFDSFFEEYGVSCVDYFNITEDT